MQPDFFVCLTGKSAGYSLARVITSEERRKFCPLFPWDVSLDQKEENSDHLSRTQQILVEGEEGLVDFKDIVISVQDKIFDDYIGLLRV